MCFGSAFIAANSSAQFKVRQVYLTIHPEDEIYIEIYPIDKDKAKPYDENDENSINYFRNYTLYKLSDFLGQKKTLSLNYDTDMRIDAYL